MIVLQSPGSVLEVQADELELKEFFPDEIIGMFARELGVGIRQRCVLVCTNQGGWEWQIKNLRTYGDPWNHSEFWSRRPKHGLQRAWAHIYAESRVCVGWSDSAASIPGSLSTTSSQERVRLSVICCEICHR